MIEPCFVIADPQRVIEANDRLYRMEDDYTLTPLGRRLEIPSLIREWADALTPREKEVLRLVARTGGRYKDVADELGLSPRTIRTHMGGIYRKSNTVINRVGDAVMWGVFTGIVNGEDILESVRKINGDSLKRTDK